MSTTLYRYILNWAKTNGDVNSITNDPYGLIGTGPEDDNDESQSVITYESLNKWVIDTDKYSYWGAEDIDFVMRELEASNGFRKMYNIKPGDHNDKYYFTQLRSLGLIIQTYLTKHADGDTLKLINAWPENHIRFLKKLLSKTTIAGENSAGAAGIKYVNKKWIWYIANAAIMPDPEKADALGYSSVHKYCKSYYQGSTEPEPVENQSTGGRYPGLTPEEAAEVDKILKYQGGLNIVIHKHDQLKDFFKSNVYPGLTIREELAIKDLIDNGMSEEDAQELIEAARSMEQNSGSGATDDSFLDNLQGGNVMTSGNAQFTSEEVSTCRIKEMADRLEKYISFIISQWEKNRGVGDVGELEDLEITEENFRDLILERADEYIKQGMYYRSGWFREKINYLDNNGVKKEYPIKRFESFFIKDEVELSAAEAYEDSLFNFVKISLRRGLNAVDFNGKTRDEQKMGLILHQHYSTYDMDPGSVQVDHGPAVHIINQGNIAKDPNTREDRLLENILALKKTMDVPTADFTYYTKRIHKVRLKQDNGFGGRGSYEGLEQFYKVQLTPRAGQGFHPRSPFDFFSRERYTMSPNWNSPNRNPPEFYPAANGFKSFEQQANELFNTRNGAASVGGLVLPNDIAIGAWKNFTSDAKENISNPSSIRSKYNQAMDTFTLRDVYVNTAAEIIAMQFLLHSHSLESIKLWLSLPTLATKDEDIYLSGAESERFIKAARRYDQNLYDLTAGSAASSNELSREDIKDRQLFLKQCALLMNMQQLKHAYQKEFFKTNNPNSYNDEIYTLDVNDNDVRSQMVNKLISPMNESIKQFLNSTPAIQAAIAPKLRFYRVFNDIKDKNKLKEVEIVFPKHYDPDNSKYKISSRDDIFRGGGVGIKDFSWSFEGTTPATARNDIKASLTLYFQDFSELLKKRNSNSIFGKPEEESDSVQDFRYIELLLLPGTSLKNKDKEQINSQDRAHMLNYDPANHRIRVDVGWEIRDDKNFLDLMSQSGFSDIAKEKEGLSQALSLINKSYYLNMVEHNMDFKDDGSVEIKVDYRAYLESAGKTITLDALTTIALAKQKQTLKEEYELIIKKGICKDNRKKYEQLISIYNAIEMKIIKKTHQSIIERLVKNKRLHYCTIDNASVNIFAKNGFFINAPTLTMPSKIPISDTQVDDAVKQKVETNKEGESHKKDTILDADLLRMSSIDHPANNQQVITFFYVGDLIHTILDCMKDPENPTERYPHLKNTKILLSSFDYRDQQNNLVHINLSEIPVSTEYFFEWMNQNVIKPKRRSYPITYFIRDICNKLIVDLMLEVCINKDQVKTMRFNSMNLLALGNQDENGNIIDPFTQMDRIEDTIHIDASEAYVDKKLPLRSNISDHGINKAFNYFLFYPVTQTHSHLGSGNLDADGDEGVYHFSIGRPRGILKRMKFDKTDIQYIREARFFNHGHDGLMQLSAVYKVTLELFGNTLFYPGMQIFINPVHMGGENFDPTVPGSVANSLGFGGYHLITRVESSIGPGKFNTTVQAQFVYSGDGVTGVYNNKDKATNNSENLSDKANESRRIDNIDDNACTALTFLRERSYYDLNNLDTNLAKIDEPTLKTQARTAANQGTTTEE